MLMTRLSAFRYITYFFNIIFFFSSFHISFFHSPYVSPSPFLQYIAVFLCLIHFSLPFIFPSFLYFFLLLLIVMYFLHRSSSFFSSFLLLLLYFYVVLMFPLTIHFFFYFHSFLFLLLSSLFFRSTLEYPSSSSHPFPSPLLFFSVVLFLFFSPLHFRSLFIWSFLFLPFPSPRPLTPSHFLPFFLPPPIPLCPLPHPPSLLSCLSNLPPSPSSHIHFLSSSPPFGHPLYFVSVTLRPPQPTVLPSYLSSVGGR